MLTANHFARREAGGIVVDLFWDRTALADEFRISVDDLRDGARFDLHRTTGRGALHAFHHPFAAARS